MMMNRISIFKITLIALCVCEATSAQILYDSAAINEYLQRSDLNIPTIKLNEDVQINTIYHHIQLTTNTDHLLIKTPSSSILLTNFSSLSLHISAPGTHRPSQPTHNATESTHFADEERTGGLPWLEQVCGQWHKVNNNVKVLGWSADEQTVRVKKTQRLIYLGDLEDLNKTITTLNMPLVILCNLLEKETYLGKVREFINITLSKFPMFIKVKLGDLLMNRYHDADLMRAANHLEDEILNTYQNWILDLYEFNRRKFPLIGHGRQNITSLVTLNTGKLDRSQLGQIVEIDFQNESSCFSEFPCNRIQGTDGILFAPLTNETNELKVYVNEMGRSISFVERDTYWRASNRTFVESASTFRSPVNYSPNKCYRNTQTDKMNNLDGIQMQPSSCNSGMPIVYSHPNFQDADERINKPLGLQVAKEGYRSTISVDNNTGQVTHTQMNFDTRVLSAYRNFPRLIWPVYWRSDSMQVNSRFLLLSIE